MLQQLKTLSIFLSLLLVASVFVPGIAEANNAPHRHRDNSRSNSETWRGCYCP